MIRAIVLGDKDNGKSTLIGNMLILTKSISRDRLKEAYRYSSKIAKRQEHAFILDSFEEEREEGFTLRSTEYKIHCNNEDITLIDVPGHKELIENMISGFNNVDLALLVISAESDKIPEQAFNHLKIARIFGLKDIIFCINKLDLFDKPERRFEYIKNLIQDQLNDSSYNGLKAYFIPISALKGYNLVKRYYDFGEGTVIDKIIELKRSRKKDSIARFVVNSIEKNRLEGFLFSGKLSKKSKLYDPYNNEDYAVYTDKSYSSFSYVKLRTDSIIKGNTKLLIDRRATISKKEEEKAEIFLIKRAARDLTLSLYYDRLEASIKGDIKIMDISNLKISKSEAIPVELSESRESLSRFIILDKDNKIVGIGRFVR
ncbi:MAG: elongation factor 1-alpha [Candidatus Micrarchaeota archaeon]|nr:MAG: elongation factor 1-alpha [Candidatus Micrarchaeota archaeon]